jgi:hypothetical protein
MYDSCLLKLKFVVGGVDTGEIDRCLLYALTVKTCQVSKSLPKKSAYQSSEIFIMAKFGIF